MVVLGCERGKPREEPVSNDAQASRETEELKKALEAASKSARQWEALAKGYEKKAKDMEARAETAEAKLEKAAQAQAKTPSESIPNEQRPVGDRVIRAWDGYKFRDVRIKDLDWDLTADNQLILQGVPKVPKGTAVPYIISGTDLNQVAEAWVIEYVTGKKVNIPKR